MLLGREAEQRQIGQLLRRARAGQSGLLVLRGEPGIGKTALLGYAASRAGTMRVLRAAGAEPEAGIAFAGLYSLLHPVIEHLGALPEGHAAALRAALGLGSGPVVAPERLAVAAGTFGLLATVAEAEPLLVLVDDLHWLDPASTDALLFAVRRLSRDSVACVFSTRPALPGLEGLPVHDLAGLAEPDAALLVEAAAGITPVPAVARRLHAQTGGNPLALTEAAAALTPRQLTGADLPEVPEVPLEPGEAVRQRFAARLAGLDPAARVTLLVVAAAGNCPASVVMAAVARLGGGQALAAAEDAWLVRLSTAGVEFCHPLVRSVAYHQATPSQRRAAHRALADALAGRDRERAAWHLAAAATDIDDAVADELDAVAQAAERKVLRKWPRRHGSVPVNCPGQPMPGPLGWFGPLSPLCGPVTWTGLAGWRQHRPWACRHTRQDCSRYEGAWTSCGARWPPHKPCSGMPRRLPQAMIRAWRPSCSASLWKRAWRPGCLARRPGSWS
jgi:AAA ATPase domain